MGFLKKLLVEEIPNEVPDYDEELYMEETLVEVNTDSVSQENLVSDIYTQNSLSDLSKSIFKVEELINSLPKEMPSDTKKATVLSILGSFGLTVDEVIADGISRKDMLNAALDEIITDNENVIAVNNTNIELKKQEIQELEKDNANRESVIKNTEDKIDIETKRISDLIAFVGGEK